MNPKAKSDSACDESAETVPAVARGAQEDSEDDGEWDDEWACTHCGGEGWDQVDDPMLDDCDEFGEGPCKACRGTGLRKHQWVF